MSSFKLGIIIFFVIIYIFFIAGCLTNNKNTRENPHNSFNITPIPTIKPNFTGKLEEFLSINWGSGDGEVGNYCDFHKNYAYLNKISYDIFISYGPRDFFVDKNENIYVLDSSNYRLLKFRKEQFVETYSYKDVMRGFKITEQTLENLTDKIDYKKLKLLMNKEFSRKMLVEKLTELNFTGEEIEKVINHAEVSYLNYPLLYTDSLENIYIAQVSNGELIKLLKLESDNIILFETNELPSPYSFKIKVDEKSRICREMEFRDEKMEITFPLKPIEEHDFKFLGVDQDYNFYFSKNIIVTYPHSEEDKVSGIVIKLADCIIVNKGFILFKYNSNGKFIKEVKINDPIPYNIRVNAKGNIYLSPRLIGKAILQIPLDKYRIYKITL